MPRGDMQQTYEYKVNFLQVKCTKNMEINFQESPAFMCYYSVYYSFMFQNLAS